MPEIGLISEQLAGNYFGPFRDSPNTAAPGGLGFGWCDGKGASGREEKAGVHGGGSEVNGSFPEQPCSTSVGSPLLTPWCRVFLEKLTDKLCS
jgi:hypothetical protein